MRVKLEFFDGSKRNFLANPNSTIQVIQSYYLIPQDTVIYFGRQQIHYDSRTLEKIGIKENDTLIVLGDYTEPNSEVNVKFQDGVVKTVKIHLSEKIDKIQSTFKIPKSISISFSGKKINEGDTFKKLGIKKGDFLNVAKPFNDKKIKISLTFRDFVQKELSVSAVDNIQEVQKQFKLDKNSKIYYHRNVPVQNEKKTFEELGIKDGEEFFIFEPFNKVQTPILNYSAPPAETQK